MINNKTNIIFPYLTRSVARRISFRNLLESILSSRTASPSLKNNGFTIEILTFLKNQRFRPKNCFKKVLELCRAPFGSFWGQRQQQEASKRTQVNPKTKLDVFFVPKWTTKQLPKYPQKRPKRAQESPKTLSKPSLVKTLDFFKNIGNPIIKLTFSMIETWVWELEIGKKSCPKNNVEL